MSYVYIFRNGNENLFKIGKSVDVEDRIRGLATGNPRLAVFDKIETEDEDEWEAAALKASETRITPFHRYGKPDNVPSSILSLFLRCYEEVKPSTSRGYVIQ